MIANMPSSSCPVNSLGLGSGIHTPATLSLSTIWRLFSTRHGLFGSVDGRPEETRMARTRAGCSTSFSYWQMRVGGNVVVREWAGDVRAFVPVLGGTKHLKRSILGRVLTSAAANLLRVVAITAVAAVPVAFGQGRIDLSDESVVLGPVGHIIPADNAYAGMPFPADGLPSGKTLTLDLFAGTSSTGLTLMTSIPLGAGAGSGDANPIGLPMFPAGTPCYVQLKAHDASYVTFESTPLTAYRGASALIAVTPGGSPAPPPPTIGWHSVTIIAETPPPFTAITLPANGWSYGAPASIPITALATNSDATIQRVEFYANGALVGVRSNTPYAAVWANVTAGAYALTARAYDIRGFGATSALVNVTVVDMCPVALTPTNVWFSALGGTQTAVVSASGACSWNAAVYSDWLGFASTNNGTGSRSLDIRSDFNDTFFTRTGHVSAGNLTELAYDDGVVNFPPVPDLEFEMQNPGDGLAVRFTPQRYPFYLESIAVNILNYWEINSGDPRAPLEVRVYADDNGRPGTELASGIQSGPANVPPEANRFVRTDLVGQRIVITNGEFFIGLHWTQTNAPQITADWYSTNGQRTWVFQSNVWQKWEAVYTNWPYAQPMIHVRGAAYSPPAVAQVVQARAPRFEQCFLQPDGTLKMALAGEPKTAYAIEVSTNLVNWVVFRTNTLSGEGVDAFSDPTANTQRLRFYRAVYLQSP